MQLPANVMANSPLMQAVFHDASLIAPSESRVLITGESGVGKEVLAEVIHAWSARAAGPLVKVNCAAIPETLLESELFGHEKGAFTSAVAQRIGRFEEANGGTIFLDEIGDMSPPLQAKLLRVTQDGCFNRVGSNREMQTNARILAATNRNLEEEVKAGRFREDLFYRLNVVELNLPPLRERPEDILPLASAFHGGVLAGQGAVFRGGGGGPDALRLAGERARVAQRDGARGAAVARRDDLARASAGPRARPRWSNRAAVELPDAQRLEEIERQAILQALRKHEHNRTETAKALGISRRALIYKLQRFREQGFEVDPR